MNARDVATAVGGLVAVAASTVAALTIWVLLTAPTTMAGVSASADDRPLQMIARLLFEAIARLIRYL